MSAINAEHKETSEKMAKLWELDVKKVDAMESDFMDAMNNIITDLTLNPGDKKMKSCYDAGMILSNISDAIEQYQNVFHIIRTTLYWKEIHHV